MRFLRVVLASLALVIFEACATTEAEVREEEARPEGMEFSRPGEVGVFVEWRDEHADHQRLVAFLPVEWLEEEAVALGEFTLAHRPVRRGTGPGPRRPPPLLNPRPAPGQLRYWQRPPDARAVEQTRQLYYQRLAEAEAAYPNSSGYENHHGIPIYLGGSRQGPTYKLRMAYHKAITQEFRRECRTDNGTSRSPKS